MRGRERAPGSAGPVTPGEAPEPFDEDNMHLHPVPLSAGRGRGLLRGLQQRHPVAHLPRRHRAGDVPPRLVVDATRRQPALRRGGGRGRRARAPRVGPRLPAAARAGDACASCGPTCASAGSTTSPSRRSSCSPSCRGGAPAARGPARGRLPRLPAPGRRRATSCGPAGSCSAAQTRREPRSPSRARTAQVRASAIPISVDFRGLEELARSARRHGARQGDPREPRQPRGAHARRRPARLHQGHPAPAQGLRGAAAATAHRPARRRAGAGGDPEPRARRRLPQPARARSSRPSGASTASTRQDRLAGRPLPAPLLPARGDGGPVPGRRRHARHPAARRHEPRRQGVRHLPPRPRRRARAVRVHRRVARAAPGLRLQPARHRGPQADDPARHQHPGQGQAPAS